MKYLLTFFLLISSAFAGQGPEKLRGFLSSIDVLSARFEQSILNMESGEAGRFQGMLYLSRPGKFRWDYTEPYEKQILADGDTVYVVDTDLDQITYVSQERALKGTPASILVEQGDLNERFEVIDIGESQGMDWVELLPRDEESQFTRILIAFLSDDIRRMEISDKFGQITRFQFYDIEQNPELEKDFFKFKSRQGFDQFGDF